MPVSVGTASRKVKAPAADRNWHAIAKGMYWSLAKSGQSEFFEPSDWQLARLAAEATTRMLEAERFSAVLLAAVDSMWSKLLMTEADRRRMRIELARPKEDTAATSAVADLDDFRKRFSG
ncbi:MAG TPA: hypothetical protein VHX15_15760 [Frankiaceae bacterium]|nr:hypothetical protein [Frankiaceae bacterium]